MLVYRYLLRRITRLRCQIFVIVQQRLVLVVQLQTLIFKIIPLLQYRLQLHSQRIIYKPVLNRPLKLVQQSNKLLNLNPVTLDKLLLMPQNSLFKRLTHILRSLLNISHKALDGTAGLA